MAGLTDGRWLRRRVAAGASIEEIAAESGRRPSSVRDALRRHGIATPLRRARQADRVSAVAAWKRGGHVDDIAAARGRSVPWVRRVVWNVPRDVVPPRRPRRSRFAGLNDVAWLREELASGRSIASIAHEVGSDAHNVRYMLTRHELR